MPPQPVTKPSDMTVHLLWINAGLSCDGDSVSFTAAQLPSVEDIVIFRVCNGGMLRVEPVPWDVEALYGLPASVWRASMDQFFPGGGWLRLRTETIDRLQAFRGRAAEVTWDETIEALLERAEANQSI